MQLESQVGFAAESIASRNVGHDETLEKLIPSNTANNIYINSCKPHNTDRSTESKCNVCEKNFQPETHMTNHTEVSHELESFACIFCDSTFQCNEGLNAHIENQHNADDANLSLKTRVLAVEMVLVRVMARV